MSDSEYVEPSGSPFPPVLDACCGSRAFWFDKKDSWAVYVDKRRETVQADKRTGPDGNYRANPLVVDPDQIADFRALPFPSDTFALVVFDPPHVNAPQTGNVLAYYGTLGDDWRDMLRRGFAECFRVLRPEGVLVFKWNETQIPLREILALTPEKPLFGHKSGKLSKTHWIAFLKPNVDMRGAGND